MSTTYTVRNLAFPSLIVDLSGDDNRSVIAYPANGGSNQKWEFVKEGNEGAPTTIRNVSLDTFLGILTPWAPTPGAYVFAEPPEQYWTVVVDGTASRLHYQNSDLVLAISRGQPGEPLRLLPVNPDDKRQLWTFE